MLLEVMENGAWDAKPAPKSTKTIAKARRTDVYKRMSTGDAEDGCVVQLNFFCIWRRNLEELNFKLGIL